MKGELVDVATFEGRLDELIGHRSTDIYRLRPMNSVEYRAQRSKLAEAEAALRDTLSQKSKDQLQEVLDEEITLSRMEADASYLQGLFDGITFAGLLREEGRMLSEHPCVFQVENREEDAALSEVASSAEK